MINQVLYPDEKITALYLRLLKEDEQLSELSQSNSISNQKSLF
jgi:hypothetical protein